MSRRQTPNEFLQQIIGRPVVVKLNSGVDYRGKYKSIFIKHNTLTIILKNNINNLMTLPLFKPV